MRYIAQFAGGRSSEQVLVMRKNVRSSNGSITFGYHQISAAANLVGVSQATLRLWESYGLVKSTRTDSGYRIYSPATLAQLTRIQQLREEGINLAGIQSIISQESTGKDGGNRSKDRPNEAGAMAFDRHIGRHIRQLRQSCALSITEVSKRAGLSPSFISLVERSMSGISISSLEAICGAMGSSVREVLGLSKKTARRKVPARDRRVLPSMDPGMRVEQLVEGDTFLDCQLFTLAPGKQSQGSYAHEGEEFIFILSGTLEVTVDHIDRYNLKSGDSLCFRSTLPHSWRNPGKINARGIWINTGKSDLPTAS
jgi:DNA-binding transcriptional MerR regulator/mannose-6-phosphate isomerase-like protein (cupin superfamily)